MNLIPERLALVRSADYTNCPEVQAFIMAHADDPYLNVQAYLYELENHEPCEVSEEYRVLPVHEEKQRRSYKQFFTAALP